MMRIFLVIVLLSAFFCTYGQSEEQKMDSTYLSVFGEPFILGDSLLLMTLSVEEGSAADSLSLEDQITNLALLSDSLSAISEKYPVVPIDSLINYSLSFVGTPYRMGGGSTKGFDCSGFVSYLYNKYGLQLPRSSREQALIGEQVNLDAVQKGDLIFFKGRNIKSKTIGHVALVIEVSADTNDVKMIHSTRHGLRTDWLSKEPYYKNRYVTSRRLEINQP